MVPLRYWIMRTLRRNTPQWLVDVMLDRGLYLRAGRDTSAPLESVAAYRESVERRGKSLDGQTICVVGAGGGLGIGVYLLEAGAGRVILQEPFAPERIYRNQTALDSALVEKYLHRENGDWSPRNQRLCVVRDLLEDYADAHPQSIDLVFSNSVLEHVTDVDSLVAAMARLLRPNGLAVHFIDLRDHYFRYPFEMLCYSQTTWDRWLNASNTLNRWRLPQYEASFNRTFANVQVDILQSLPEDFRRTKPRIRPEHLTGDDQIDTAAIIRIEASHTNP